MLLRLAPQALGPAAEAIFEAFAPKRTCARRQAARRRRKELPRVGAPPRGRARGRRSAQRVRGGGDAEGRGQLLELLRVAREVRDAAAGGSCHGEERRRK